MKGWIHQSNLFGFNLELGQVSSNLTRFSIKLRPKLSKSNPKLNPNPSNLTDELMNRAGGHPRRQGKETGRCACQA